MATVKKGTLTPAPQCWKHLRDWKRVYWNRERKAAARGIMGQLLDDPDDTWVLDHTWTDWDKFYDL